MAGAFDYTIQRYSILRSFATEWFFTSTYQPKVPRLFLLVYLSSFTLFTTASKLVLFTMSAKGLGTLAMIYATDELQNPILLKTMLCEGDMNNPVGRSDVFCIIKSIRYRLNIVWRGEGLALPSVTQKGKRSRKILKRYWCSNYFWQALYLEESCSYY